MPKSSEPSPLLLFGRRLSELRKVKGWSQERLALESGLARSYVGGVERGQRNISLLNICLLADTLGLAPSNMLEFANAADAIALDGETHRDGRSQAELPK